MIFSEQNHLLSRVINSTKHSKWVVDLL